MGSITHAKRNNAADWTQATLNAQIALGNYPVGTLLADIILPSDWNNPLNFSLSGIDVGLPLVNNTSDIDKPISLAVQTALNLKQSINSNGFIGNYVVDQPVILGQQIYITRSTGKADIADAAIYTKSFVIGFANTPSSTTVDVVVGNLELSDWSLLTGTVNLSQGLPYYLNVGGGITSTPPSKPSFAANCFIGLALSPYILFVNPKLPFLL